MSAVIGFGVGALGGGGVGFALGAAKEKTAIAQAVVNALLDAGLPIPPGVLAMLGPRPAEAAAEALAIALQSVTEPVARTVLETLRQHFLP